MKTFSSYITEFVGSLRSLFNKQSIAFGILSLGVAASYLVAVPFAVAGPGQPFGGQITSVTPCACSLNGAVAVYFDDITVTPPITLPLIFEPGVTIDYDFHMATKPGSYILGTWNPVGECLSGKLCTPIPTAGTMFMVGSSI